MPAIWQNKADFDARFAKFVKDVQAAQAGIVDEATFKQIAPPGRLQEIAAHRCHELVQKPKRLTLEFAQRPDEADSRAWRASSGLVWGRSEPNQGGAIRLPPNGTCPRGWSPEAASDQGLELRGVDSPAAQAAPNVLNFSRLGSATAVSAKAIFCASCSRPLWRAA